MKYANQDDYHHRADSKCPYCYALAKVVEAAREDISDDPDISRYHPLVTALAALDAVKEKE